MHSSPLAWNTQRVHREFQARGEIPPSLHLAVWMSRGDDGWMPGRTPADSKLMSMGDDGWMPGRTPADSKLMFMGDDGWMPGRTPADSKLMSMGDDGWMPGRTPADSKLMSMGDDGWMPGAAPAGLVIEDWRLQVEDGWIDFFDLHGT
jgi:hypothetical protein